MCKEGVFLGQKLTVCRLVLLLFSYSEHSVTAHHNDPYCLASSCSAWDLFRMHVCCLFSATSSSTMPEHTHPDPPYLPQAFICILFHVKDFATLSPELSILNHSICRYSVQNKQGGGICSLIIKQLEAFSGPDLTSKGLVAGIWNHKAIR